MLNLKKLNQRGETSVVQTVMIALLIVAAFFIGMLWTKVQNYEKGIGGNVVQPTPIAGGPSFPGGEGSDPTEPAPVVRKIGSVTKEDYVRGNRNARIAILEWSDTQCPYCKSFHPTVQQITNEYSNDIMWVYRHFPLDQIHPNARAEAVASECAAKQGGEAKFWAFIDRVYETASAGDRSGATTLPEIAKSIGLNVANFNTCLNSQEAKDAVQADFEAGIAAGIGGTPGVLLFDTKTGDYEEIQGAVPYASLKKSIEDFKARLQ